MHSSCFSRVLGQLNWNQNYILPVADKENSVLECEVQKLEEELENVQKHSSSVDEKVQILLEHLKNVKQEFQYTSSLNLVRKKEIESEQHLTKIYSQERDRHQREILKLEREIGRISDTSKMLQTTLFEQEQKYNKVKSALNWDTNTLDVWLEECNRREKDIMLIQKYSAEDESLAKQLRIKTEQLLHELDALHKSLDRENAEIVASETELDRTAEVFRKMHSEQGHLIRRLEQVLDQLQERDSQIDHVTQLLLDAKEIVGKTEKTKLEKELFLKMEIENNAASQKKVDAAVKESGLLKTELHKQEDVLNEFTAELKRLKLVIFATDEKLKLTRSENVDLLTERKKKLSQLEKLQRACSNMKLKLTLIQKTALTAEGKSKVMDALLKKETEDSEALFLEVTELFARLIDERNKNQQATMENKITLVEIDRLKRSNFQLDYRIKCFSKTSAELGKDLYTLELKCSAFHWRIDRMEGQISDKSEMVVLERNIHHLKKNLQTERNSRMLLEKQQKLHQTELSRIRKLIKIYNLENFDLVVKHEDLELNFQHLGKEMTKLISTKQNLMVDLNILEVKARHMYRIVSEKAGEVIQQKKRRLTLESAFAEQLEIVSARQKHLSADIRKNEKEREKIVHELNLKFDLVLKKKHWFETSLMDMLTEYEDYHAYMCYYMKKITIEKGELLQEGDSLDERIKKSEKELAALRNTVAFLNCQISAARQSLRPVPTNGEAMQEKQHLERLLAPLMLKLKMKRKQVAELKDDNRIICGTKTTLHQQRESLCKTMEEKQIKLSQAKKDAECSQKRLDGAEQQYKRLLGEVRTLSKVIHELPEEMDIRIRELREMNKKAMKKLDEVIEKYPEMKAVRKELCLQAGLSSTQSSSSVHSSSSSSSRLSSCSRLSSSSRLSSCSRLNSCSRLSNYSFRYNLGHNEYTPPSVKKSKPHKGK